MSKSLGKWADYDFRIDSYPVDGFQFTVEKWVSEGASSHWLTVFDRRMIGFTLFEALGEFCDSVLYDYELAEYLADKFQIPVSFSE